VVSDPVAADGLEQREGTHEVGRDEGGGVAQRVVVVGLRREVDHEVGVRHEGVDDVAIGDVTDDERDGVAQIRQRIGVACVRELVQHRHRGVRPFGDGLVDEVGTDETGASCDEYTHGNAFHPWGDSLSRPSYCLGYAARAARCRRSVRPLARRATAPGLWR